MRALSSAGTEKFLPAGPARPVLRAGTFAHGTLVAAWYTFNDVLRALPAKQVLGPLAQDSHLLYVLSPIPAIATYHISLVTF